MIRNYSFRNLVRLSDCGKPFARPEPQPAQKKWSTGFRWTSTDWVREYRHYRRGGGGVRKIFIGRPTILRRSYMFHSCPFLDCKVLICQTLTIPLSYILQGSKCAKFGVDFRPQSPLRLSGFEKVHWERTTFQPEIKRYRSEERRAW